MNPIKTITVPIRLIQTPFSIPPRLITNASAILVYWKKHCCQRRKKTLTNFDPWAIFVCPLYYLTRKDYELIDKYFPTYWSTLILISMVTLIPKKLMSTFDVFTNAGSTHVINSGFLHISLITLTRVIANTTVLCWEDKYHAAVQTVGSKHSQHALLMAPAFHCCRGCCCCCCLDCPIQQ